MELLQQFFGRKFSCQNLSSEEFYIFFHLGQSEEPQDEANGMREQLVQFLREPRVPMDTDVLEFWKTQRDLPGPCTEKYLNIFKTCYRVRPVK